MKPTYTRHGISRAGDDYQDLQGAEILVGFLEHPERFQWVKFEAGDAGYLDDICACLSYGICVFRQVKFTVDPEDPEYEFNRDYLLERKAGKIGRLPSRLQKWSDSLAKLKRNGKVSEASLITNRQPSQEIKGILSSHGNFNVSPMLA